MKKELSIKERVMNKSTKMQNNTPNSVPLQRQYIKRNTFLRKIIILGSIVVLILISVFAAFYFFNKDKSVASSQPIIQNAFGKQAVESGVSTCAPLFSTLGQTMTAGSQYKANMFGNKNEPNKHAFSALVGQTYPAQNTHGSGAIFVAPTPMGCEGTMVRTVIAKASCQSVVNDQLPKNVQRQKDLANTAVFVLPEGGTIMLTQASSELCVVVTTMNLSDIHSKS